MSMVLLVVFAGLAGAGTALSPCVLPVLPALLSAGATGGRRRPVGIAIGLAMMVPSLATRLEAPLAPLSRYGPRGRGDGLRSGLGVGAALGFVYAPCAGPILAAVITVGAASARTIPVAIGFAAGSALVLLALAFGGRSLADPTRAA